MLPFICFARMFLCIPLLSLSKHQAPHLQCLALRLVKGLPCAATAANKQAQDSQSQSCMHSIGGSKAWLYGMWGRRSCRACCCSRSALPRCHMDPVIQRSPQLGMRSRGASSPNDLRSQRHA
jgi:hypothetical protein